MSRDAVYGGFGLPIDCHTGQIALVFGRRSEEAIRVPGQSRVGTQGEM